MIFTDACLEGNLVGLGALLYINGWIYYFGVRLSLDSIMALRNAGYCHFISAAELIPIPLAIYTFYSLIRNQNCLFFVDNDYARAYMINGWSSLSISTDILSSRCLCSAGGVYFWIERVASPSNPSDDLSRGSFDQLIRAGATRVRVLVPGDFPSELGFENL